MIAYCVYRIDNVNEREYLYCYARGEGDYPAIYVWGIKELDLSCIIEEKSVAEDIAKRFNGTVGGVCITLSGE